MSLADAISEINELIDTESLTRIIDRYNSYKKAVKASTLLYMKVSKKGRLAALELSGSSVGEYFSIFVPCIWLGIDYISKIEDYCSSLSNAIIDGGDIWDDSRKALRRIFQELVYLVLDNEESAISMMYGVTPLVVNLAYASLGLLRGSGGYSAMIVGKPGSGKTTLMFLTIYSFLRNLGLTHRKAVEYTDAFLVNSKEKLLDVINVSIGEKIPILAIDDAVLYMDKYLFFQNVSLAKNLGKLVRILKENVGALLLASHEEGDLVKFVREGVYDSWVASYRSTSLQSGREIRVDHIIWENKRKTDKVGSHGEVRSVSILSHVLPTSYPPLIVPTHLYSRLTSEKLKMRAEIAKEVATNLGGSTSQQE